MAPSEVEIEDLTQLPGWENLLQLIYRDLYLPNFPDAKERERPADWLPRLEHSRPKPPQPLTYVLVAGNNLRRDDSIRVVHGFLVAELYQESNCGLLTYIVVASESRKRGLARQLIGCAVMLLRSRAHHRGQLLRAVFGEVHNPHGSPQTTPGLDPYARINLMYRLGARHVPIRYVQPALGHNQGRSKDLLLVAFPLEQYSSAIISGEVLKAFLEEFYRALGVTNPRADTDFQRMTLELDRPTIELKALCAEEPCFTFRTCAVAMHFVCSPGVSSLGPVDRSSPEFQSFERDLISFSYRDRPPFLSDVVALPQRLRRLEVAFPRVLEYKAEGDDKELWVRDPNDHERRRRCTLHASRTVFPDSTAVLHLVLTPDREDPDQTGFNEWDLLKLVKLWEGGEGVDEPASRSYLRDCLRFIPRDSSDGLSLDQLVRSVFRTNTRLMPRMGTVQVLTHDATPDSHWEMLFRSIGALAQGRAIPLETPLDSQIKAVAGLLQGMLDFPYVDIAELEDVFKPVSILNESLVGVHKGTVLELSADDRAFHSAAATIGISPYLILPQAVLCYNDDQLGTALAAAPSVEAVYGDELQRAASTMRRALQRNFVPNVFHYPLESSLYEIGMQSRRTLDLKGSLERTLGEVESRWDEYEGRRQQRFANWLLIFGSVIAFLQLVVVIDILGKWLKWPWTQ